MNFKPVSSSQKVAWHLSTLFEKAEILQKDLYIFLGQEKDSQILPKIENLDLFFLILYNHLLTEGMLWK